MTNTGLIFGESMSTRGIALIRRLRTVRAQAAFLYPNLWISYVIQRDLREPLVGGEIPANVEITTIQDPAHPDFEAMARISRMMGVSRIRCMENLKAGSVGAVAHVHEGSRRIPAATGWMTWNSTPVPFLNARFEGSPHSACLLYQDFVAPEYRGMGLQKMLGRHRLNEAINHGVRWAYGYIRRANTFSLRNASSFTPVAVVHNLRSGRRAIAHVRCMGHRKCDELPFANWPHRQAFLIPPGHANRGN